ncbi:stage V sporulation protein AD [Clostridium sp. DL1XJH146]
MNKRIGKQTLLLNSLPKIIATTSIVGPKEGNGPLKEYFDIILDDDLNGQKTFEKAESSMLIRAINETILKGRVSSDDVNYIFSGDLLNQLTATNFAVRETNIPFIGLYGACSTMAESISLASIFIDGGYANYTMAATSSHFSSAERQFRLPLEMGSQRAPYSQWTVTGAGSMLFAKEGEYPYVKYVTLGKIKDYGIQDTSNMGAAMAPAAVDTINQHFIDTGRKPADYDLIATGDLGAVGRKITYDLLNEYGYDLGKGYIDCGEEIFDCNRQKTNAGGSGCGCSAVVSCGLIYKKLLEKKLKKVLLVSTGALMSTTSSLQGESIPGIAHAISIEFGGEEN